MFIEEVDLAISICTHSLQACDEPQAVDSSVNIVLRPSGHRQTMQQDKAPFQEVLTLPISPFLRQKLLSAGFRCVSDLVNVLPVNLTNGVGPDFLVKLWCAVPGINATNAHKSPYTSHLIIYNIQHFLQSWASPKRKPYLSCALLLAA